jgi:hypothetical protein
VAIDRADAEALWKKGTVYDAPAPEYRLLQTSQAWTHMLGWIKELREKAEKEHASRLDLLQHSQVLTHDGLLQLKTSLAIAQAELYTIREIEAKLVAYHKEED